MTRVVSVLGKGGTRSRQVRVGKANVSEPLLKCRKRRDVIETGLQSLARDKFGGYLLTARSVTGMKGGASPAQALVWNVGTYRLDVKGEAQAEEP